MEHSRGEPKGGPFKDQSRKAAVLLKLSRPGAGQGWAGTTGEYYGHHLEFPGTKAGAEK